MVSKIHFGKSLYKRVYISDSVNTYIPVSVTHLSLLTQWIQMRSPWKYLLIEQSTAFIVYFSKLTFYKSVYLNNTLNLFILQSTFNIFDYISQISWLLESTATVSIEYSSSCGWRWFAPDLCSLLPLLLRRSQGRALLNVAGKQNCSFSTLYLLNFSLCSKIHSVRIPG